MQKTEQNFNPGLMLIGLSGTGPCSLKLSLLFLKTEEEVELRVKVSIKSTTEKNGSLIRRGGHRGYPPGIPKKKYIYKF